MAEYVDHQVAAPFLLIDLLRHQGHQLLLLGVQQDGVHHPPVDDQRVKGPADEVGDPQVEGPLHVGGAALRRDHDHRDVLNPAVFVHHVQHAEAVQPRHDNIQQHQRDLTAPRLQHGNALTAVFRLQDLILIPQHIRQDGTVHLRVVHNEDLLFVRNSLQSRPAPFLRTPCRPLVAASGHRRALFGIIT